MAEGGELSGRSDMAEKLDPRQLVTFEELLTNEEVLEEIKVVRREMEGKRGR